MSNKNIKEREQINEEKVLETVSKTDLFFKENGNIIYGCIIAFLLFGAAILAWHKFYLQPKKVEAMSQMYSAEANFRNDEFELALNGDGNVLGFAQVIDEYGAKAGKVVYLYAGVCELNLSNYESAIKYLKKYNGKDKILAARALACIGDAYSAMENYNSAVTYYERAAKKADNMFAATYLLKAGVVCEELKDNDKALKFYKEIKENYPQSIEGYEIDKYISRVESLISK